MEVGQLCRVGQKGSAGKMAEQGRSKSLGSAVLTELLPRLGAHISVPEFAGYKHRLMGLVTANWTFCCCHPIQFQMMQEKKKKDFS